MSPLKRLFLIAFKSGYGPYQWKEKKLKKIKEKIKYSGVNGLKVNHYW